MDKFCQKCHVKASSLLSSQTHNRDKQVVVQREDEAELCGCECVNCYVPISCSLVLGVCCHLRWSPWYNRSGWLGVKHQFTYTVYKDAAYKADVGVCEDKSIVTLHLLQYKVKG